MSLSGMAFSYRLYSTGQKSMKNNTQEQTLLQAKAVPEHVFMAMDKNKKSSGDEQNNQDSEALDSLSIVVGEIAHDFNNVLSLIFGYVEMALSEIPEGERARSDLEHVLAAGDRAKELVARILTYSNQKKLKQSDIQLVKPVSTAIGNIRDKLPPNIHFEDKVEDRNALIYGNASEIMQVIANLCNNSIQAIDNNEGTIEVELEYLDRNSELLNQQPGIEKSKAYARLSVEDDGCGMDLETLEKIYTPFFSTSKENDLEKKRAGLGMTTVYNIVTSMSGHISVESEPGMGTRVEILFPLSGYEAGMGAGSDADVREQARHILFIDDETAITEMADQMLKKGGHKVTTFNDGNKAADYFSDHPHEFDLVITDLVMPQLSGTELSQKISSINPNIPIILTTGFSEKITTSSCKKWGISLVMNKPFVINDLLTAIDSLS